MANVTLYTPEELTAMGWVFTTSSYDKTFSFDDSFAETFSNGTPPDDFPDAVSFSQFKPYFTGPSMVPTLSYSNFAATTLFWDIEKYQSPLGNWAMAFKATNAGVTITGITITDTMQATLALVAYAETETSINYDVQYKINNGSYATIYEGWAEKQVDGVIPIVNTPILFRNAKSGDKITLMIRKLTSDAGKLYLSAFGVNGFDAVINTTLSTKSFTDPKTGEVRAYSNVSPECVRASDSQQAAASYASAIEYGEQVLVASEPGKIYFEKEELYQWISPQQLEQFEKMYPQCVEVSYDSALGYLYSQIGELYDIPAILAGDTNDGTAKIMRWILTVLTAYNITSPSARHSETLRDNFDMVVKKITEMKNGATTLNNAPTKDEPSAWGTVVNSGKHKMLG